MSRWNGYAVAALRHEFRGSPELTRFVNDVFGPPLNDYDILSADYRRTNLKPDKLYSILPTVLSLARPLEGKTLLDLGCGDGFMTEKFAEAGAGRVVGLDNSIKQIELARSNSRFDTVEYRFANVFTEPLASADVIVAAYIINYLPTVEALRVAFSHFRAHLNRGGKLVLVVDLPTGRDLKRFGAVKTLKGPTVDGTEISIDLYDQEQQICSLRGVYFTEATLVRALAESGFKNIRWHRPFVSPDGVAKYGEKFWSGYVENPELGYLTAGV